MHTRKINLWDCKIGEVNIHICLAHFRAEKTEVLSEELQSVEQRVDQLHSVLLKCKAKLCECLRTKPGQDNVDKRKVSG